MNPLRHLVSWLRAEDVPEDSEAPTPPPAAPSWRHRSFASRHPWLLLAIAPAAVIVFGLAMTGFVVVVWPREHAQPPAPAHYFQPGYGPVRASSSPSSGSTATSAPSTVAGSSSPVVQDSSATTTGYSSTPASQAEQGGSTVPQSQAATQAAVATPLPSSASSAASPTSGMSGLGAGASTILQQVEAMCAPVNTASAYTGCASNGSIACQATTVPAPIFGSYGEWSCSTEVYSPNHIYTTTASCVGDLVATCRTTAIDRATALLQDNGCPAPIAGTISSSWAGNRINLTVRVPGPDASPTVAVILDTGGVDTQLPNSVMVAAGFRPSGSITTIWPLVQRGTLTEYIYHVPYPEVLDNGTWVPLGYGTATIYGVANMPSGVGPLIGPDMLKAGTQLGTVGAGWTLTPPCP